MSVLLPENVTGYSNFNNILLNEEITKNSRNDKLVTVSSVQTEESYTQIQGKFTGMMNVVNPIISKQKGVIKQQEKTSKGVEVDSITAEELSKLPITQNYFRKAEEELEKKKNKRKIKSCNVLS